MARTIRSLYSRNETLSEAKKNNYPWLGLRLIEGGYVRYTASQVCVRGGGMDAISRRGIEQALTSNMSVRISYARSHGYHMLTAADPNSIVPEICVSSAGCAGGGKATDTVAQGTQYIPVAALPNPYLAAVASSNWLGSFGISSYNALNVAFTRRISSGLQFKANYTWAKAEDISAGYSADGADGARKASGSTSRLDSEFRATIRKTNLFSAEDMSCPSEGTSAF